MVTRFRIYFIACINVPRCICNVIYKLATFNNLNSHSCNGSGTSSIAICYVYAHDRRRRSNTNNHNRIPLFHRCSNGCWYSLDFLLYVMDMKKTAEVISAVFFIYRTIFSSPLLSSTLPQLKHNHETYTYYDKC